MADEILIFDAAASNPDGTDPGSALSIGPGTSYPIAEASFPAPPLNVLYSSSVDTEGENPVSRRYGNRTITLKMEMAESGANDTLLHALQAKIAKFQREGGTLKRTLKDGTTVRIYDIVAGEGWDPVYDLKYILGNLSEVTIQLPAKPLARGAEVDLGDNTQTTDPTLFFTEAGNVTGDVAALGRLVIDEDQAVDQQWLVWGMETDALYDITQASAALFYQAEGRLPLGGSAIAVGPSGASGAGSNVMRNTALSTNYSAVMSTASSGSVHLTHVGTFAVFARVQAPTSNVGPVSLALEWGVGDFRRFTQNATYALDTTWEGAWRIAPLGLVTIPKALTGSQRWEGRILAKSTTAGDDIDVDWLMLIPADIASGEVAAVDRNSAPTTFAARDEFDQTAGALTGKVAPAGGTWGGAGDADDFTVSGTPNFNVTRAAISDTAGLNNGRFGTLGVTNYTNIVVRANSTMTTDGSTRKYVGLLARYTNTSNWLIGTVDYTNVGSATTSSIIKNVAGTITVIRETAAGPHFANGVTSSWSMMLRVDATGRARFYVWTAGGEPVVPTVDIYDPVLATGGTLQTGLIGLFHHNASGVDFDPTWDNFSAAVPVADAAVFASQSIQIRHDGVIREDSTGAFWQPPSSYVGDYLRVPPAGAESRDIRVIIKGSRFAPGEGPDAGTDDISARLFVTPRFLT